MLLIEAWSKPQSVLVREARGRHAPKDWKTWLAARSANYSPHQAGSQVGHGVAAACVCGHCRWNLIANCDRCFTSTRQFFDSGQREKVLLMFAHFIFPEYSSLDGHPTYWTVQGLLAKIYTVVIFLGTCFPGHGDYVSNCILDAFKKCILQTCLKWRFE